MQLEQLPPWSQTTFILDLGEDQLVAHEHQSGSLVSSKCPSREGLAWGVSPILSGNPLGIGAPVDLHSYIASKRSTSLR